MLHSDEAKFPLLTNHRTSPPFFSLATLVPATQCSLPPSRQITCLTSRNTHNEVSSSLTPQKPALNHTKYSPNSTKTASNHTQITRHPICAISREIDHSLLWANIVPTPEYRTDQSPVVRRTILSRVWASSRRQSALPQRPAI